VNINDPENGDDNALNYLRQTNILITVMVGKNIIVQK